MDLSFMAAQVKGSPPRAPHLQIAKFGEIRGLALSKPGSPPGLEPGGDTHGRIPAQPFVASRAPTWCAFPWQRARLHAQGSRGGSGHCSRGAHRSALEQEGAPNRCSRRPFSVSPRPLSSIPSGVPDLSKAWAPPCPRVPGGLTTSSFSL